MPSRALIVAAVLTVLPLAQAGAVEFHHPEGPFVPVHNCTCRLNGEEVPVGERRCLRTAEGGAHAAQCVLEQNVTSWRSGGEECPQASLYTPRRAI